MKRKIILATRSPARRTLLKEAGIPYSVAFADIDETRLKGEAIKKMALRLAVAKAKEIAKKHSQTIIITADTLIAHGSHIFGKPESRQEAAKFLRALSGKWHKVYTGTVVLDAQKNTLLKKLVITKVKFAKLSKATIDWYIKTGEPMKAAGAYSIQHKGRVLIEAVNGCLSNVIGISVPLVIRMLKKLKAL